MRYSIEKKILHFKQPAGTSRGVYLTRKLWLIHLYDDQSEKESVGECAPLPDLSCDALSDEEYERILRQFLQRFIQLKKIPREELRNYPSMLMGLETAWLAMQNGHPCLYETPFAQGLQGIKINGLVWMGSYDEMKKRMEQKLSDGFGCIKLKIGAINFEDELALIRQIRGDFSEKVVEIRVDANGGFTPQTAPKCLEELSKFKLHSIEQPIRQKQWKYMAELCRNTPIPIALDEELIGVNSLEGKCELLDVISPQYIVLKPSLHGGFSGAEEWIALAQKKNIGRWATSALESNIGLMAIAGWTARQLSKKALSPMPQGLGTGQLFADNFESPLVIKNDELWYVSKS